MMAPDSVSTALAAPGDASQPPAEAVDSDRCDQRYRWRCLLCQLFARQYRGDAARAKAAKDYAYSKRKMIHDAFDRAAR